MKPTAYVLCIALALFATIGTQAQTNAAAQDSQHILAQQNVMELHRLGLPYLALEAARKHPLAINDQQMRQLEADYAADLTRLATVPTRHESERYRIADRALTIYDRLIPEWQAQGPAAIPDLQRIRLDRLQALRARYRMQDVIDDYLALQKDGVVLPPYALTHVAAAYLYLRKPDEARRLYQRILNNSANSADDPSMRVGNQMGMFYALVELEEHAQAREVIDTALGEQPIWVRVKGIPQPQPNPLRLDVEHAWALSHLYADDTPQAQELLTDMVKRAPNNASLRTSLSALYRTREWPLRARQELKLAESMAPRAIVVEAEQAQVAMDLGHWEQAEILIDDLQNRAPEHTLTQNIMRRWSSHNKAELNISAQGGLISDNPVTGQNDIAIESVLYSAPINYHWRPFAGVGYAHGEFEEGETDFRWVRAGVQWQGNGLTAELEASSQHYGHGAKVGARISASYELNDHWQIGGAAALRSIETPVRALHHNIRSNSVTAFTRWRAHERREWSLSTTASRFTDGNKRVSLYLSGRERLYTTPRMKLDAELGVYASKNSKRDAPYFNPRADIEVMPSVRLTHLLYRRYERKLEHSLQVGAGVYGQKGYGSGAVGSVAYGMRYQYHRDFEIGASLIGVSRPYDGQREREMRFMLDMTIRF